MKRALTRVLVVGGGFGGLSVVRALKHAQVQITLIDKRNFHLFQPLLYQVATGGLSPADIAAPLRSILKKQNNVEVILGDVTDFDPITREVILSDGERIAYDILILATGATHHYFGQDQWEPFAPGLKTLEDAQEMRRRILWAFEQAERAEDPQERDAWLTFVVIGGGPTGVELSGAIAELAHHTLKRDFRRIDPTQTAVYLLENAERVLPPYPTDLSAKAQRSLEKLGVTVWTQTRAANIEPGSVECAGAHEETLRAQTVFWAAGARASSLCSVLQERLQAPLDRNQRVMVELDWSLPGHPEIFVIGDLAHYAHQTGAPLPGVAQVAMQSGKYVARRIRDQLNHKTTKPFRYLNLGDMAVIGRNAAVANLHVMRLGGWLAWLAWLFIHLMYLVGYESKLIVLIQWAWNYLSRNRRARLILGEKPPLEAIPAPEDEKQRQTV